jgi:hypothetical protein
LLGDSPEPLLDVNVVNTGEGGMLGIDIANPDDEFDRPSWCSSTIPRLKEKMGGSSRKQAI